MNNYNFKKLNKEEKWQETDKSWVKDDPEEYIRLLIVNDDIDLLKKFETLNNNFSYDLKDGILLTLAMQKNAFATIDYLLEKKLAIKQRDVEALVKNFRELNQKREFLTLLDKIDFSKINLTAIFEELEYYLDDEATTTFVEYLFDNKINIEEQVVEKLKKQDNLAFIFKKQEKEKEYNQMSEKYTPKNIKEKSPKI